MAPENTGKYSNATVRAAEVKSAHCVRPILSWIFPCKPCTSISVAIAVRSTQLSVGLEPDRRIRPPDEERIFTVVHPCDPRRISGDEVHVA